MWIVMGDYGEINDLHHRKNSWYWHHFHHQRTAFDYNITTIWNNFGAAMNEYNEKLTISKQNTREFYISVKTNENKILLPHKKWNQQ